MLLNSLRRLLSLPAFGDEDQDAKARSLYMILLGTFLVSLIAFAGLMSIGNRLSAYGAVCGAGLTLVEILLVRRRFLTAASTLLLASMPIVTAYLQWVGNGLLDVTILLYPIVILMASLLLTPVRLLFITVLALFSLGFIIFGHVTGRLDSHGIDLQALALDGGFAVLFLGIAALVGYLLARSIRQNLVRAHKSEERFSQLFRQNDDALFLLTLDTYAIIDVNPAALQLFDLTREDLHGANPFTVIIAKQDFDLFVQQIRIDDVAHDSLLERATGFKKDGTKLVISMRGKILNIDTDYFIFCSIRDMTEKVRLEEEIKSSQAKLIQANKMTSLGMLVSGVAHEINNPNQCIAVNNVGAVEYLA